MLYIYNNANRLPQMYAGEQVFDRRSIIIAFEHDYTRSGIPTAAQTYGLPCVRTRDLSAIVNADTVFVLDASCFYGLRDFIVERLEQKCTVHLLGAITGDVRAMLEFSN